MVDDGWIWTEWQPGRWSHLWLLLPVIPCGCSALAGCVRWGVMEFLSIKDVIINLYGGIVMTLLSWSSQYFSITFIVTCWTSLTWTLQILSPRRDLGDEWQLLHFLFQVNLPFPKNKGGRYTQPSSGLYTSPPTGIRVFLVQGRSKISFEPNFDIRWPTNWTWSQYISRILRCFAGMYFIFKIHTLIERVSLFICLWFSYSV